MDENEIRIGDTEREDAVRRLGEHYEAGRLTADEHSERVEQALQAKTATDLNVLFADLPGPHQPRPSSPGDESADASTGPRRQPGSGWSGGRPPWAASAGRSPRGGWVPRLGGIPVPLLVLLGIAVIAGLACTFAGGHPPFFLLIPAAIATFIVLRRRPRNTPA